MKKQPNKFRFTAILILLVLLVQNVSPVLACGPSFLEPIFIFEKRPDLPREDFLSGNIGVINPTYSRSNLYVAYRYLNNAPLTPQEQESINYFWERHDRDESDSADITQRAGVKWVLARNKVTNELPPNYSSINLKDYAYSSTLEVEKKYKGYISYVNCNDNALTVAAETLQNRISSYGADNQAVKEWLKGQEIVFSNCSQGKNMPPDAAVDAPQWLKNDREYQIAAANFYIGNFDEARNRFAGIANNSSSVWHELADYLVGRTFVRQANLAEKENDTKTYYEKAEQQFQAVIAKNTKYKSDAQALLNLVKFRLNPEQRTHELSRTLIKTNLEADLGQDLIDYMWLLDRYESDVLSEIDKKLNPPETPSPEPQPTPQSNSNVSTNSASNTVANLSNSSYRANSSNSVAMSNMAPAPTSTPSEPNKYTDDTYPYYYRELNLTQKDLPAFLQEDDLSDWLFNYQFSDGEALTHAIERWRKTRKEHWLLSILTKLKGNNASTNEFLQSANQISRSSKSFPTATFQAARLLVEQGKAVEARTKLDSVLSDKTLNLPVSAHNQFLQQRMYAAENLDEFLKFSLRKPSAFAWDDGGGYEVFAAKPKGEDYLMEERAWKDRWMFDVDAQQIFEQQMPLSVLKEVVKSPRLPDYLKRQLLLTIWSRAVLIENDSVMRETAPLLARYAPETQTVINQYLNSSTPAARRNSAIYALIKFPAFEPHFRYGMGRLTPLAQIDNYRDNWWCAVHEKEDYKDSEKPLEVPQVKFLSDAEIETARNEKAKLQAVGDAPPFLVTNVLEWAKSSPNDGRVPEALHLAVKTTRYGCYSENIGKYSKDAFDYLHSRYPGNAWTKKTPYWFNY